MLKNQKCVFYLILMVFLKFVSQTVMEESTSLKRFHVGTGSTPHKPVKKRPREGKIHVRKPLDFSVVNESSSVGSSPSLTCKVLFSFYISCLYPFLFIYYFSVNMICLLSFWLTAVNQFLKYKNLNILSVIFSPSRSICPCQEFS